MLWSQNRKYSLFELYGYDAEIGAMVMEDLCHMEVLRDAQNKMSADDWIKKFSKVSEQLAVWVAEVAFATSDFSMDCAEKHKMVSKFSNPELCTTSNAVFFVQPWTTHEMNNHEDYLKPTIKKMQDDVELKTAVIIGIILHWQRVDHARPPRALRKQALSARDTRKEVVHL